MLVQLVLGDAVHSLMLGIVLTASRILRWLGSKRHAILLRAENQRIHHGVRLILGGILLVVITLMLHCLQRLH